ncbi:MAG: ABC transporter permease [Candidatus Atribacteria bacterium]|nr:ABC transporter permease [Candidatus Atribacteria bacterium]
MIFYIIRRFLFLPIILLGISLIIFVLFSRLSEYQRLATYINNPERLKSTDLDKLIELYGLRDPAIIQYGRWLKNVFSGNLGWSYVGKEPVYNAILRRFPFSVELTIFSVIPIILLGTWFGVLSAIHHNRPLDHTLRIFSVVGWSFPDFVFGLFILMIFYSSLNWFPPGNLSIWASDILKTSLFRSYTGMLTIDSLLNRRLDIFFDALRHLIGPVITLTYVELAFILRITRSSMLEVLQKDYIRTARAKGLSEKVVINKHAKRNAMIPVATVSGQTVLGLLSGTVIVETIFNRTGLGSFMALAAQQLDYASIMGGTLFFGFILIIGNLIVDVSYAVIDPRVRLE